MDDGIHHFVRWLSWVDGDGACLLIAGPEWGAVLSARWLGLTEFLELDRDGVLIRLFSFFHVLGARPWL